MMKITNHRTRIIERRNKGAARPHQKEVVFRSNAGHLIRVILNGNGPWFSVKDFLKAVSNQKAIALYHKLTASETLRAVHTAHLLKFISQSGLVGLAGGARANLKTRRLIVELLAAFNGSFFIPDEETILN